MQLKGKSLQTQQEHCIKGEDQQQQLSAIEISTQSEGSLQYNESSGVDKIPPASVLVDLRPESEHAHSGSSSALNEQGQERKSIEYDSTSDSVSCPSPNSASSVGGGYSGSSAQYKHEQEHQKQRRGSRLSFDSLNLSSSNYMMSVQGSDIEWRSADDIDGSFVTGAGELWELREQVSRLSDRNKQLESQLQKSQENDVYLLQLQVEMAPLKRSKELAEQQVQSMQQALSNCNAELDQYKQKVEQLEAQVIDNSYVKRVEDDLAEAELQLQVLQKENNDLKRAYDHVSYQQQGKGHTNVYQNSSTNSQAFNDSDNQVGGYYQQQCKELQVKLQTGQQQKQDMTSKMNQLKDELYESTTELKALKAQQARMQSSCPVQETRSSQSDVVQVVHFGIQVSEQGQQDMRCVGVQTSNSPNTVPLGVVSVPEHSIVDGDLSSQFVSSLSSSQRQMGQGGMTIVDDSARNGAAGNELMYKHSLVQHSELTVDLSVSSTLKELEQLANQASQAINMADTAKRQASNTSNTQQQDSNASKKGSLGLDHASSKQSKSKRLIRSACTSAPVGAHVRMSFKPDADVTSNGSGESGTIEHGIDDEIITTQSDDRSCVTTLSSPQSTSGPAQVCNTAGSPCTHDVSAPGTPTRRMSSVHDGAQSPSEYIRTHDTVPYEDGLYQSQLDKLKGHIKIQQQLLKQVDSERQCQLEQLRVLNEAIAQAKVEENHARHCAGDQVKVADDVQQLRAWVLELKSEIAELQAERNQLNEVTSLLVEQKCRVEGEVAQLEQQRADGVRILDEHNTIVEHIWDSLHLERGIGEHDSEHERVIDTLKSHVVQLLKSAVLSNGDLVKHTKQSLIMLAHEADNDRQNKEQQLQLVKQSLKGMQHKLNDLTARVQQQRTALHEYEVQTKQMQMDADSAKQATQQQEQNRNALKAEQLALQRQKADLQSECETNQQAARAANEACNQAKKNVDALQLQAEQIGIELARSQVNLVEVQSKLAGKEAAVSKAEAKLNGLNESVDTLGQQKEEWEDNIKKMSEQVKELQQQKQALQQSIDKLREQDNILETSVQTHQQEANVAHNSAQKAQQKLKMLQEQCEQASQNTASVQEQYDAAQQAVHEATEQCAELQVQITQLKEQQSIVHQDVKDKEQQRVGLEVDINLLRDERQVAQRQLECFQHDIQMKQLGYAANSVPQHHVHSASTSQWMHQGKLPPPFNTSVNYSMDGMYGGGMGVGSMVGPVTDRGFVSSHAPNGMTAGHDGLAHGFGMIGTGVSSGSWYDNSKIDLLEQQKKEKEVTIIKLQHKVSDYEKQIQSLEAQVSKFSVDSLTSKLYGGNASSAVVQGRGGGGMQQSNVIKSLQKELASVTAQLSQAQRKASEFESEVVKYNDMISSERSAAQNIVKQNAQLSAELWHLTQQATPQAQHAALKEQLSSIQQNIKTSQSQLDKLVQDIEQHAAQLAEKSELVTKADAEMAKAKAELDDVIAQCKRVEQSKNDVATVKHNEQMAVEQLKEEKRKVESYLARANAELDELEQQRTVLKGQVAGLVVQEREVGETYKRLNECRDKVRQKNEEYDRVQDQIQEAQLQLESIQNEVQKAKYAVENLQQQQTLAKDSQPGGVAGGGAGCSAPASTAASPRVKNQQIKQYQQQIQTLQNTCKTYKNQIKDLQSNKHDLEQQIEQLQVQCGEGCVSDAGSHAYPRTNVQSKHQHQSICTSVGSNMSETGSTTKHAQFEHSRISRKQLQNLYDQANEQLQQLTHELEIAIQKEQQDKEHLRMCQAQLADMQATNLYFKKDIARLREKLRSQQSNVGRRSGVYKHGAKSNVYCSSSSSCVVTVGADDDSDARSPFKDKHHANQSKKKKQKEPRGRWSRADQPSNGSSSATLAPRGLSSPEQLHQQLESARLQVQELELELSKTKQALNELQLSTMLSGRSTVKQRYWLQHQQVSTQTADQFAGDTSVDKVQCQLDQVVGQLQTSEQQLRVGRTKLEQVKSCLASANALVLLIQQYANTVTSSPQLSVENVAYCAAQVELLRQLQVITSEDCLRENEDGEHIPSIEQLCESIQSTEACNDMIRAQNAALEAANATLKKEIQALRAACETQYQYQQQQQQQVQQQQQQQLQLQQQQDTLKQLGGYKQQNHHQSSTQPKTWPTLAQNMEDTHQRSAGNMVEVQTSDGQLNDGVGSSSSGWFIKWLQEVGEQLLTWHTECDTVKVIKQQLNATLKQFGPINNLDMVIQVMDKLADQSIDVKQLNVGNLLYSIGSTWQPNQQHTMQLDQQVRKAKSASQGWSLNSNAVKDCGFGSVEYCVGSAVNSAHKSLAAQLRPCTSPSQTPITSTHNTIQKHAHQSLSPLQHRRLEHEFNKYAVGMGDGVCSVIVELLSQHLSAITIISIAKYVVFDMISSLERGQLPIVAQSAGQLIDNPQVTMDHEFSFSQRQGLGYVARQTSAQIPQLLAENSELKQQIATLQRQALISTGNQARQKAVAQHEPLPNAELVDLATRVERVQQKWEQIKQQKSDELSMLFKARNEKFETIQNSIQQCVQNVSCVHQLVELLQKLQSSINRGKQYDNIQVRKLIQQIQRVLGMAFNVDVPMLETSQHKPDHTIGRIAQEINSLHRNVTELSGENLAIRAATEKLASGIKKVVNFMVQLVNKSSMNQQLVGNTGTSSAGIMINCMIDKMNGLQVLCEKVKKLGPLSISSIVEQRAEDVAKDEFGTTIAKLYSLEDGMTVAQTARRVYQINSQITHLKEECTDYINRA